MKRIPRRRVSPRVWFEVNTNDDGEVSTLETYHADWEKIGPLMITTTPYTSGDDILTNIMSFANRVIPSRKTSQRLSWPFDSVSEWQKVADDCQRSMDITGENVVHLESETATLDFFQGDVGDIDYDAYENALASVDWPDDLVLWWYPGVRNVDQTWLERSRGFTQRAKNVFGDRMRILHVAGWSGADNWPYFDANTTTAENFAIDPNFIPMIFIRDTGSTKDWQLSELPNVLQYTRPDCAIYPHWFNVDRAAEAVSYLTNFPLDEK